MVFRNGQKLHVRLATAAGGRKFEPPLSHHRWVTLVICDAEDISKTLLEIELPLDEYGRLIAQQDASAWVSWTTREKK